MKDQEIIKNEKEIEEIHLSKNNYFNIENIKYQLKIEIENDEIIFTLNSISPISYYNYIRKYKYNDIIKELNLSRYTYDNLIKIYNYFDSKEYNIIDNKKNKKLIINNKDSIILYETNNQDIIKLIIEEINKQNDKIKELIKMNENKDNKLKTLENNYNELKQKMNRMDELIYRKEINLIYEGKGIQNIFGKKFVENNKNNVELIINGKKYSLMDKFRLVKGDNHIKLIIINEITNLESMFEGCNTLKNIDELKYLNTKNCTNFSRLFSGCSLLSDISSLEYWNISNGKYFMSMFDGCTSLSDKKPIKI